MVGGSGMRAHILLVGGCLDCYRWCTKDWWGLYVHSSIVGNPLGCEIVLGIVCKLLASGVVCCSQSLQV